MYGAIVSTCLEPGLEPDLDPYPERNHEPDLKVDYDPCVECYVEPDYESYSDFDSVSHTDTG